MAKTVAEVLDLIQSEEVAYVDVRFTDPKGKLQHVTLDVDLIDEDFFEYNRHNPSCALWTERCLLGETAVIINETPSSQSLTHKIPGTISQLDSV